MRWRRLKCVYWDGRLDNRRDLGSVLQLSSGGTASDEALVLATYERWGVDGLGRVIGDWSVIIRDARRQTLMLASDYAGVRPLFYVRRSDGIDWSSRLDVLIDATGATAIDEAVRRRVPDARRPSHAHALCRHQLRARPRRAVSITPAGSTTCEIWTMPTGDVVRYADERRYDEQLRELFRDGVAARLRHAAPALAELSGGLDSSSVVCMAHQLIRRGEVPATGVNTISYVHEESLDYPFIREVENVLRDRRRASVDASDAARRGRRGRSGGAASVGAAAHRGRERRAADRRVDVPHRPVRRSRDGQLVRRQPAGRRAAAQRTFRQRDEGRAGLEQGAARAGRPGS